MDKGGAIKNRNIKPESFPWLANTADNVFEKNKTYPKVSVIVPSFNQGEYLEETLLSIIRQEYPNLELIVIDGGSTDESVAIIKKYEDAISYWVSEADRGQSHAINKGLEKATGEWVAWMNSDDCYMEGALYYIYEQTNYTAYDFLFGNCYVGAELATAQEHRHPVEAKQSLKDILRFFYHVAHIIPSQSVFIKRDILKEVGFLNEDLHYCMDLDWYSRIFLATEKRLFYQKTICFYRVNEFTKTSTEAKNKVPLEALKLASLYSPHLKEKNKKELDQLISYFYAILQYNSRPSGWAGLLRIAFRFRGIALTDIKFRIILKRLLKGDN